MGGGWFRETAAAYACLYGGSVQEPVIPAIGTFLGPGQTLWSAALIFLFLLAPGNLFKIK